MYRAISRQVKIKKTTATKKDEINFRNFCSYFRLKVMKIIKRISKI